MASSRCGSLSLYQKGGFEVRINIECHYGLGLVLKVIENLDLSVLRPVALPDANLLACAGAILRESLEVEVKKTGFSRQYLTPRYQKLW